MNVYALFPLVATIAYIPLLITTASSRPWQRRHTLFIIFLSLATMWSLTDYFFRGNFFPQHNTFLFEIIVILFLVMGVQFHLFTSSFFAPGQGRWLPFAYGSLIVLITLVLRGYITGEVTMYDNVVHGSYRPGVVLVFLPLLTLVGRNLYVFGKRLKILDNPALYNQIVSLMLGMSVLTVFTFTTLIPWGKEFPLSHFGNLINAFILSYAVIRHHLLDLRLVLRQGTFLVSLGIIGIASYWLLLIILHAIFRFELDLTASFAATAVGLLVFIFIYKLRGSLYEVTSRIFQGPSYDYRQRLSDFANTIQNVFSLKEQGGELLALITKAIRIKQACLLFPEAGSEDFSAQFAEPKGKDNELSNLKLRAGSSIVKYLERERKPLTRENLAILPEFLGLWTDEREDIKSKEIELFMPLISRGNLIAILVLGKKQSSRYLLEDHYLLEDVTSRVAVSMEKEYLREQLREREEELSIINRSSSIMTSSLDIQEIYGNFIEELKKVVDVSWAAIVLVDENGPYCKALSSEQGSAYQVGDKIPLEGTGTGWVVTHKRTFVNPDLSQEIQFTTEENFYKQGMRTLVYLPLIAKGEAIGSFIVASRKPHAYKSRHIMLLEQLAAEIAMPVENTRLYEKAEEKARIDELTGLLNRRSLDEMIDSEINRHSRYGGVFSLAILDLDSFKKYNDTYGHPTGDKLLRQAGRIIKSAIRNSDQAFRYGGDEFAVLLPLTTAETAHQVTERVRRKIAQVEAGDIQITASIGLASWPTDGIGHTDIIAAADVALYRAKRGGGNQSHYASGTLLPLSVMESSTGDNVEDRTLSVIYALAETVDARHHCTFGHIKDVTEYALSLAEALKLEPQEVSKLETCALLHDIGKIGISDEILDKPGELTAEEWETIRTHPQLGACIVGHVPQLAQCVAGIKHHHERYDGTGYPAGLKGDEIPLEARVLAIADAFAAMTAERSYSENLSYEGALEEIKRGAGTQFDPNLVEVFVSIYEGRLTATRKKIRR
jgi:diguanylate cyclase (GGDEF)-like protein